jgi:hypothetical protein
MQRICVQVQYLLARVCVSLILPDPFLDPAASRQLVAGRTPTLARFTLTPSQAAPLADSLIQYRTTPNRRTPWPVPEELEDPAAARPESCMAHQLRVSTETAITHVLAAVMLGSRQDPADRADQSI